MNISSLIDRQIGLQTVFNYDNILTRLIVKRCNSYLGICPNESSLDYNPYPPLFACRFAEKQNYENILALANEDGKVAIHNTLLEYTGDGEPEAFSGIQCHANAVFDVAWMPNTLCFVTVSGDHTAILWDLGQGSINHVTDFKGHQKSVRTATFNPDRSSIFATGGRDGKILIWDSRISTSVSTIIKPDNTIYNCHPYNLPKTPNSGSKKHWNHRTNSITGLVFQDDYTLISCGSGDGSIRAWDLRRNYSNYKKDPLPKYTISYSGSSSKNGYSNLLLDKSRMKLYANSVDNVIYCFNILSYSIVPEQKYVGHKNDTFYIRSSLSPDSKYLVSGSSDHNAYIWNVKYADPIVKLTGHNAEVTCAAWCQVGDIKIISCSDDSHHKIWTIGNEYLTNEDLLDLRGKAVEIPPLDRINKPYWESLEKTPQSCKRKSEGYSDISAKKRILEQDFESCQNSESDINRKSKRSLIDMMNDSLLNDGIDENNSKRRKIEQSTLNTFEYDIDTPSTSFIKGYHLPVNLENSTGHLYNNYGNSSGNENEDFNTPTKSISHNKSNLYYYSPNRVHSSPTMNLPNFVIDGKAPHLGTPVYKKKHNIDWLTKMRHDISNSFNNKNKNIKSINKGIEDITNKTPDRHKSSKTLLQFFACSSKNSENKSSIEVSKSKNRDKRKSVRHNTEYRIEESDCYNNTECNISNISLNEIPKKYIFNKTILNFFQTKNDNTNTEGNNNQ